jgi:putative spermidine/putrescine transport system permease protein
MNINPVHLRRMREFALKTPVTLTAIFVLTLLTVPILAIIPMSFSSSVVYELIPSKPSLVQYRTFFSSADWMAALSNSLQVALGTMVLATVLGTTAALGLKFMNVRWRALVEMLFVLPQIVPTIVYAVAAYFVFQQLRLTDTLLGLIIAHSMVALPFVVLMVGGVTHSLKTSLLEASRSLGAGPVRTFYRVTLPHLRLAILAGALFAFQISFDEVIIALFMSGFSTKTLPVRVWDAMFYEISPILPAISTIIILVPLILSLPLLFLQRKRSSS